MVQARASAPARRSALDHAAFSAIDVHAVKRRGRRSALRKELSRVEDLALMRSLDRRDIGLRDVGGREAFTTSLPIVPVAAITMIFIEAPFDAVRARRRWVRSKCREQPQPW